ncbi:hypothetical protein B0H13DRAFT_2309816 [Mycena leptocephala]|nr:hypothetical protein B0H13DRAFT_2309816 [Mycena leptocephala]
MAVCGSGYEVASSTVFFSSRPDAPAAQSTTELKLLKALTKELRSCVKSATPFHKAVKVIGTDIEKKLRLFPNAILGHDSSTDEWIVKLMPSGAHDVAANLLMAEIVNQYWVANNSNISAVCYPSGTQTFRLTPTRSKQADQSFCSVARPLNSLPVVVMEVGVSESPTITSQCLVAVIPSSHPFAYANDLNIVNFFEVFFPAVGGGNCSVADRATHRFNPQGKDLFLHTTVPLQQVVNLPSRISRHYKLLHGGAYDKKVKLVE